MESEECLIVLDYEPIWFKYLRRFLYIFLSILSFYCDVYIIILLITIHYFFFVINTVERFLAELKVAKSRSLCKSGMNH